VDDNRTWSEDMPTAYERALVPTVFAPFSDVLAPRVLAPQPARVLELAAGTGVLTRLLADGLPRGGVVATDLNPAMVELGRAQVPAAEWQAADALDLPFAASSFDAVVCQFGVMFFPGKRAGFAQARRVLAPGGQVLMTTWGPLAEHHFEAAVTRVLARVMPDDPPTFLADLPHGYADPDRLASDARAGGLEDVRVELLEVEGHAPSVAALARGYCEGTPLRAALERRGDHAALTAQVVEGLVADLGPGPLRGRMTAYLVTGSS
jgi:SAM-dependent methyltransferase